MKAIIVTFGPSLMANSILEEVHKSNFIYRINGAHANKELMVKSIDFIRSKIEKPKILIDLPGNKIRTSNTFEPIEIKKGDKFTLKSNDTNFSSLSKYISINDSVYADDSTLHLIVNEIKKENIVFISNSVGTLKENKGIHIRGIHDNLPFLFERDYELIDLANNYEIDYVGLSFVRNGKDILDAKKLINNKVKIIAKVETKASIENLDQILSLVNYILIDRGDLSTDVGIEKVPFYQKLIVDRALFNNINVFLATQFLKNMEKKPLPLIAEAVDLYNSFKMGIYGIQLSEETAVGMYPKECLTFVNTLMNQINSEKII
jgi:pyruvate kinase